MIFGLSYWQIFKLLYLASCLGAALCILYNWKLSQLRLSVALVVILTPFLNTATALVLFLCVAVDISMFILKHSSQQKK